MDNFRRNFRDFLNFIKERLYDAIFEKFFFKSVFAYEEIPNFAIKNEKTLKQINNNEKNDLMKGLEYISVYNEDFTHLRNEYIITSHDALNFSKFQLFIRKERNGYYFKKAIEKFIFRALLVLLQLLMLIYKYPKHFCVDELIDDKSIDDNTMFWINDIQKYKVTKGFNEPLFYLRIMSFILDLILLIPEFIVLYNLRRIKANLLNILIFQFIRLSIYVLFIYYEYSENFCEEAPEKNKFYRIEKTFSIPELIIIFQFYKLVIF